MNPKIRALYHAVVNFIDSKSASVPEALEALSLVAGEFEDRLTNSFETDSDLSWAPGVPTDTCGYEEMLCGE